MRKFTAVIAVLAASLVPVASAGASAHSQAVKVAERSARGLESFGYHDVVVSGVDRCVNRGTYRTCTYGLIATAIKAGAKDGSCLSFVVIRDGRARSGSLRCTDLF